MLAETVDVVVANALIKPASTLRAIESLLQPLYVTSDNGICIDCAVVSSNAVWLRTSEFRTEHPLEIDRTRDCENCNRVVGCAAEGVGDDTTGCSDGTLGGNIFTTGGTVGCKMGAPETVDLIDGLN